jgi:hypothetical protein
MKITFLGIGLGLALVACGGTTDNSSGSGGGSTTGSSQGGTGSVGGTGGVGGSGVGASGSVGGSSVGGSGSVGGSSVGGSSVGGAGGSSCSDVPAPVGQLECGGGSSAVSSGSGPIACATSCTDQADNAYEVFCQGNECECHYYPASSGKSQGTSVASSSSGQGGSSGSGGTDPSLICTCTVSSDDACASQQHCCPAPWQ